MTIEPELLMAYADGALDPLTTKRVERAIANDPALAEQVARHRRLKSKLSEAYAPIADDPVPDRLAAMLTSNVVQMPKRPPRARRVSAAWQSAAAMAACLVVGVVVGRGMDREGSVMATDHGLYAA
ncbi:anti-sigma factor family protein, partial [Sphingomonas zeae]